MNSQELSLDQFARSILRGSVVADHAVSFVDAEKSVRILDSVDVESISAQNVNLLAAQVWGHSQDLIKDLPQGNCIVLALRN